MADRVSNQTRSFIMSRIRSKDTLPELAVRKYLFSLGYRYRLHLRTLPGSPDIVLPKYRTAIQVRGCFWHSHSCMKGKVPENNRKYWQKKLSRNRERDKDNDTRLKKIGWDVVTLWECAVMDKVKIRSRMNQLQRKLKGKRDES